MIEKLKMKEIFIQDEKERMKLAGNSIMNINETLVVFGGWTGSKYSNQLILIDLQNEEMKLENTEQRDRPQGRRDHGMAYDNLNNRLFMFGGWNSITFRYSSNEFNTLHFLDGNWQWKVQPLKPFDSDHLLLRGRRGHTFDFIVDKNLLVSFGGVYGFDLFLDEILLIDLYNNQYQIHSIENHQQNCFWPQSRAWHSSIFYNQKLYYFGGLNQQNKILDEILQFDIDNIQWTNINYKQNNDCIFRLFGHQTIVHENLIYILGGRKSFIDEMNTDEEKTQITDCSQITESKYEECFQNMRKMFMVQIQSDSNNFSRKDIMKEKLLFFFQSKTFPASKTIKVCQQDNENAKKMHQQNEKNVQSFSQPTNSEQYIQKMSFQQSILQRQTKNINTKYDFPVSLSITNNFNFQSEQ